MLNIIIIIISTRQTVFNIKLTIMCSSYIISTLIIICTCKHYCIAYATN